MDRVSEFSNRIYFNPLWAIPGRHQGFSASPMSNFSHHVSAIFRPNWILFVRVSIPYCFLPILHWPRPTFYLFLLFFPRLPIIIFSVGVLKNSYNKSWNKGSWWQLAGVFRLHTATGSLLIEFYLFEFLFPIAFCRFCIDPDRLFTYFSLSFFLGFR